MEKCRICLKGTKKIRSVFDKEGGILFIDMITSLCNIKVTRDDKITYICLPCSQKLKEAFYFKNMIEMSHLFLTHDTTSKRIYFNNIDEVKIKISVKKEIYENDLSKMILENWFSNDSEKQLICFKNTTIKKVASKNCAAADKQENINDYFKSFKNEPIYENSYQDYDYEPYEHSNGDDEYLPPKYVTGTKGTKYRKGKEIRNTGNKKIRATKITKHRPLKVFIKPVLLEDIRIVRTKVKQNDITPVKRKKAINIIKQMCNYCGKMTSSMKTHILVHTGKKTHKCDSCAKAYYTLDRLKAHKKRHELERKYKCDQCVAKFSDMHSLKGHMAVHNDEKQFVCEICNKSFKRINGLKRHVIYHNSANKKIKCDQCDMTFFSSTSLKHHVRVHTGERPYRCEICSQGYSYKHDFNRHCFKKHGVFLKRRLVSIMNEEVLIKERDLMRALMLRLHGVLQGDDPIKEFEGPQGYKALEQAIQLLETKQLPVDI